MIADEAEARAWLATRPEFDAVAAARLERLVALLTDENTRQNLVSAASLDEVWRRHIVDSAQLLALVSRETPADSPWLDLGTGAGFPGLVIAALLPERAVWMVESRARRIDWLHRAVAAMDLPRARVLGSRLELVESRACGVISARAFAPLDRLLDLSARFSTEATCWLLPKGRSAAQELGALKGWRHAFHLEPSLTDPEACIIAGHLIGKGGKKQR